jgi:putative DNA primase/helicase
MRATGVTPPDAIIDDGRLHRFHIAGHKPGTLNGAYVLHLDGCRPAGYFEDFVAGVKTQWKYGGDYTPPTPEDRRRMEAAAAKRRENDARRYETAAETARRLWDSAEPVSGRDHPYLQRKRVDSHGLRRLRTWYKRVQTPAGEWQNVTVHDVLLVPLRDITGKIWNLQAIFPVPHPLLNRDKDFLRGGRLRGLFHAIGKATPAIVICEGFSTGASIHATAGLQVYCAMSAGATCWP